jgi:hypothetical protein
MQNDQVQDNVIERSIFRFHFTIHRIIIQNQKVHLIEIE